MAKTETIVIIVTRIRKDWGKKKKKNVSPLVAIALCRCPSIASYPEYDYCRYLLSYHTILPCRPFNVNVVVVGDLSHCTILSVLEYRWYSYFILVLPHPRDQPRPTTTARQNLICERNRPSRQIRRRVGSTIMAFYTTGLSVIIIVVPILFALITTTTSILRFVKRVPEQKCVFETIEIDYYCVCTAGTQVDWRIFF